MFAKLLQLAMVLCMFQSATSNSRRLLGFVKGERVTFVRPDTHNSLQHMEGKIGTVINVDLSIKDGKGGLGGYQIQWDGIKANKAWWSGEVLRSLGVVNKEEANDEEKTLQTDNNVSSWITKIVTFNNK